MDAHPRTYHLTFTDLAPWTSPPTTLLLYTGCGTCKIGRWVRVPRKAAVREDECGWRMVISASLKNACVVLLSMILTKPGRCASGCEHWWTRPPWRWRETWSASWNACRRNERSARADSQGVGFCPPGFNSWVRRSRILPTVSGSTDGRLPMIS